MKNGWISSCVSVLFCAMAVGCRSNRVSYFRFPEKYELLKQIEKEVFPIDSQRSDGIDSKHGGMPPLPDYFGFKQAVDAYENGLAEASSLVTVQDRSLSVYGETNLIAQAARDGFEERIVNSPEIILRRNRIRRQRQIEFWGLYASDEIRMDDGILNCTSSATNCYLYLLASYAKGYRNGYRVISKLRKPHVQTYHYTGFKNLSSDVVKRAYVYGWYSACYDFFNDNPDLYHQDRILLGMDPVSFYGYWISSFKKSEDEFLVLNASKREFVKDEN